jgi:hypothetical protein
MHCESVGSLYSISPSLHRIDLQHLNRKIQSGCMISEDASQSQVQHIPGFSYSDSHTALCHASPIRVIPDVHELSYQHPLVLELIIWVLEEPLHMQLLLPAICCAHIYLYIYDIKLMRRPRCKLYTCVCVCMCVGIHICSF